MYYIAYGSNLNMEQMDFRCPTAVPVGSGSIRGYQLNFRGSKTGSYLTIDPCEGGEVPVGIWKIENEDLDSLDQYEGYPRFYDRKVIEVDCTGFKTKRKRKVKAYVYIMTGNRPIGVPSTRYLNTCFVGCCEFGLDTFPITEAYIRAFENNNK